VEKPGEDGTLASWHEDGGDLRKTQTSAPSQAAGGGQTTTENHEKVKKPGKDGKDTTSFKLGDVVETNLSDENGPTGKWYRGKIQKVHENEGKYDIKYDDDHEELAAEEACIRVPVGHDGPEMPDGKKKEGSTCGCNLM